MATVKELNLRLGSLANTKKITQAMKLISITKMNKMVQRVRNSSLYQAGLTNIVRKITAGTVLDHVLVNEKEKVSKVKVLLITSDRGLCGAFNSNLFKRFNQFVEQIENEGKALEVTFCGNKGFNGYRKSQAFAIGKHYEEVIKDPNYAAAVKIGDELMKELLGEEYHELYLVYNHFESALVQTPTVKRLVPFDLIVPEAASEKSKELQNLTKTYFEPSLEVLSDELIIKQFYFEIFYALLNSVTGENSARMRAMDSATKNCEEMIDSLTLQRNRMRQASITKELIEIISGAESL